MGKQERKIRQSIRRESRKEFQRIREGMTKHKPRWLPNYFWVRIVNIVLNTNSKR